MFKRSVLIMLCGAMCFVATGCCAIMSGSTQRIPVSSDPPGAKVRADDGTTITTPGTFTLVRKETHTLVAEYPGYEPQTQKLVKKLNCWIFLDPLIDWGIFSIPIDFMTGSADELHPKDVHFNFRSAAKETAINAVEKVSTTIVKCENCGYEIGKLEKAYVSDGHVVCSKCYEKLNKGI